MPNDQKITIADTRHLYDVINEATRELVGTHEDRGVAALEAERLDAETRGQIVAGAPVRHVIREREVMATDDPDDGLPPLKGPIVSSETVTRGSIKRGERPPSLSILPD